MKTINTKLALFAIANSVEAAAEEFGVTVKTVKKHVKAHNERPQVTSHYAAVLPPKNVIVVEEDEDVIFVQNPRSIVTKKVITNAVGKQEVYQQTILRLLSDVDINPEQVKAIDVLGANKRDADQHELFIKLRSKMASTLALGKNSSGLLNNYVNLSLERIAYKIPTKSELGGLQVVES